MKSHSSLDGQEAPRLNNITDDVRTNSGDLITQLSLQCGTEIGADETNEYGDYHCNQKKRPEKLPRRCPSRGHHNDFRVGIKLIDRVHQCNDESDRSDDEGQNRKK